MKTITEIIGGAQALLDVKFDLQTCFEETLNDHQKTFMHILRCVEEHLPIWKGYKLHLDVSDTGFPITACVTGANVHDSMPAIPMEKMTEQRVAFCYSLMDPAYDSKTIIDFISRR